MINIMYAVDPIKRIVKPMSGHAVTEQDHEASSLRFAFPDNIAGTGLDSTGVAVRVMYIRPDGGEPVAKTLTFYKHSGGYYLYDWNLQKSDLQKEGHLVFSLCILDISGGEVSEWHTTPCAVKVLSTIHTDDSDEGDDTITPTVAQRVAVLEASTQRLYSMAGGAPVVVSSVSEMVDEDKIYVLTKDKKWYYYDGSAWTAGGEYGAVSTDRTLSEAGIPADAKTVGDKIGVIKSAISTDSSESNTFSAAELESYGDDYEIISDATGYSTVAVALAEDFFPITDAYNAGFFSKNEKNTVTINGTMSAETTFYSRVSGENTYIPNGTIQNGDTVNLAIYVDGEITGSGSRNCRLEVYLVDANNSHQFLSVDITGSGFKKATFTANRDVSKIRAYVRLYAGYIFSNVSVSWGGTIGDNGFNSVNTTNNTVKYASDVIGNDGFTIFPPTAHVRGLIDIREYVDSHVPADMLTKEDLIYIMPEFFGAQGDGSSDDTQAIQNCIDYAVSNGNIPVKMFGRYKTSSTVYINADRLNIYCKDLNNTASVPALVIKGSYNKIEIDYLRATGDAVTLQSTDSVETSFNVIKLDYCWSRQARCIVQTATAFNHMFGNEFHAKLLKAKTNCIYNDTYSGGQHVFVGDGCSLMCEDWAIIAGTENDVYQDFMMEGYTKKGVYAAAGRGGKFYRIRTVEMLDKIGESTSEADEGLFAKGAGVGRIELVDTFMDYIGIDVSECLSFTSLQQSADTADVRRIPLYKNHIDRYGDAGASLEDGTALGVQCMVPKETDMCVWFDKKYVIPKEDFVLDFAQNITIPNSGIRISQQKVLPTIFNITDNCEITLCESYNPISVNLITILQATGKSAKIYDHTGTVIFDGTVNSGNHCLKCVIVPTTYSEGSSPYTFEHLYLGFNERWIIESV